jgi:hypothetical protein
MAGFRFLATDAVNLNHRGGENAHHQYSTGAPQLAVENHPAKIPSCHMAELKKIPASNYNQRRR